MGLSSNVTLSPGVTPVPSQVNLPPGPDELTFSDAFAQAQFVGVAAAAQPAAAQPVQPAGPLFRLMVETPME